MSSETNDVSVAIKLIPVPWLHRPSIAITARADTPAPRIGPLAAAAIGVAVGGGLQLAGQALRRTGPDEQQRLVESVECHLPVQAIEDIAKEVLDGSKSARSGLNEIANPPPSGARPFPIVTAAFLAGVAAGAAAARP